MQTKGQTSQEYFTTLTIIHAGLLFGQVVILGIFYYLVATKQTNLNEELNDAFQIIAPIFVVGGLILSSFLSKQRLNSIKSKPDLKYKLSAYRTMLIIKYATLEAPSLFALVCFFLTGNFLFIGLSGILIVYFAIIRPSRYKIVNDLELSRNDRDLIEEPK